MIGKKEKMLLRSRAKTLEPVVRIGKEGMNINTFKEIEKVLERRKLIKIKLLRTSLDKTEKEAIVEEIVSKTKSHLIDAIGNVIVVYRE